MQNLISTRWADCCLPWCRTRRDGEVLMVGFMNREALDRTLEGGYVTFFSRTRQQAVDEGREFGKPSESRLRDHGL